MQQIADHHRDAGLHRVEDRIVAGEPHQVALHFEPDDADMRHPRRQAQHRRPDAAADIEHQLMRLGRHRGSEKDRVDGDPIAVHRLAQPDPAAEQAILGEGRLGGGFAHLASSPAASSTARARPKSRSATISRRGIAPMLPSTRLV